MLEFDRITTLYSQEQDRVSLNATLREGGTARLWLTQRMVHRLIPALVKIIEPIHADPVYAEIIAGVSQQKAVERQEPQTPVKVTEPEHEWLVSKVELKQPQSGAVVVFCSAAGQQAQVTMNAELLRQWLSILRRVYFSAEWQGAEWPDWMVVPPTPATVPKVLH
jgi:hypothetical protein